MVRTKKNILSKCFCFATHGVYYFTTFVVSSAVPLQRQDWALHLIWTMLTRYNRWMVSFVDTICYVSKIIWQKKVIYWYLIILVLIIHECYYSCLVFLFTSKLNQILQNWTNLRLDFKAVTSKLSKKQNVTSQTTIFKILLQ